MSPERTPEAAAPGSAAATSRSLQEMVPYGVFTTDTQLNITSWNRWLVLHSGREAGQVIGRPLMEVYPEIDERRYRRFRHALTGEVSLLSAALHKHLLPMPSDVQDHPLMLQTARIAPLVDAGTTIGTITIIEDVTQREAQAAVLHRQQELDRLLTETLGLLLRSNDPARDVSEIFPMLMPSLGLDVHLSYLMNDRGTTLHLNSAGGVTPAQRETLAILPVVDADRTGPGRVEAIAATVGHHEQALEALGLGSYCCFPLAISGRVIGLASFGSYLKKTIPAGDRGVLSRITQYLSIALERVTREREITAASRAKDDFLAALSHELRTPLNPVLLLASDSAVNPDFPPEAREVFSVIQKNALLEARLIDDLLDLTRIEHGKTNLELQVIDVLAVVRDALVTVRSDAHHLSLVVDLPSDPALIKGDSARLQQVFWNLLKNAVKFTPAGGSVSVGSAVDPARNELLVTVTDTGVGIEPADLERIFGAFVQGGSGSGRRFGGLGLGLAISRKLVELHGGRIEATSRGRDRGSAFTVRLPLASRAETAAESARPAPLNASQAPRAQVKGSGRLLLVEDHDSTRVPLTRLLAKRGFDVVAVATVAEAVAEARAAHFDLVLSDIGLPDGDGFGLMKILRDQHNLNGIALTGYGADEDLARSNDAGFVAHLTKPINITSLDRALSAAFAQRAER